VKLFENEGKYAQSFEDKGKYARMSRLKPQNRADNKRTQFEIRS
jgi:hypothetical protein